MKSPKQFFALLLASLLASSLAQASSFDINPNNLPITVKFYTSQPKGNIVKFTFLTSALPANFSCYFDDSMNGRQTIGIQADITSNNTVLDFSSDAGNNVITAEKNRVKMFTVAAATKSQRRGEVVFTLDKNTKLKAKVISMTCIMRK